MATTKLEDLEKRVDTLKHHVNKCIIHDIMDLNRHEMNLETIECWIGLNVSEKHIFTVNTESVVIANTLRNLFVELFSWAVPSTKAITKLSKFIGEKTVLEVGSGLGLWGKFLRAAGVNIHCTDKHVNMSRVFTRVEQISAEEAIQKCDADVLMICWPPIHDKMAVNALKSFKGKYVIYIGEYDGCCAEEEFFSELQKKNLLCAVALNKWPMIHDDLFIYQM